MRRYLFLIFVSIFTIILSFNLYAQQSCDETLKECLSISEKTYRECLDNKALAEFRCKSMGYKPYSKDFTFCVDSINSYWDKECKKNYHQYTESCYKLQKNCKKGDIVGIINVSFKEKSNICASPYIESQGSYTLLGFWKYESSESYGFIKSFKPQEPQIFYNFNETALQHNEYCSSLTQHTHDCPILLWELQDSSAKIYALDTRYDGPASRLQIHSIPNMGQIYRASLPGMVVNITGKKRKGNNPPYCMQYDNYSRQISVGSFSISDNLLPNGEMKGSQSWKSCGHPFRDKMGFGIGKDRLSSKSEAKNKYSPRKEDICPTGEEVLINASWKFYLIR